jgi:hypothetical protein
MTRHSLTPKRQRFVDEYLVDLNGTQAAIRCGYSPKTAKVQASRLLTNAAIQKALEAGKAKLVERTAVTKDWVIKEAIRTYQRSHELDNPAAARSSLEFIGRLHNYIVEPMRTVRIIKNWGDLSDEEVAALAQGDRGAAGTRH